MCGTGQPTASYRRHGGCGSRRGPHLRHGQGVPRGVHRNPVPGRRPWDIIADTGAAGRLWRAAYGRGMGAQRICLRRPPILWGRCCGVWMWAASRISGPPPGSTMEWYGASCGRFFGQIRAAWDAYAGRHCTAQGRPIRCGGTPAPPDVARAVLLPRRSICRMPVRPRRCAGLSPAWRYDGMMDC